jgi:hypothetical protein
MDIIKIAEECGAIITTWDDIVFHNKDQLEQFAERIRADERTKASEELALVKEERDKFFARLNPSIEYVEGVAVGYGEDEIDRLLEALQYADDFYCFTNCEVVTKALSGEPHH